MRGRECLFGFMRYVESDILHLLKVGDEQCMRMIFKDYYRALCVYALKYLATVEDAEDVVQNVLIAFWENRKGSAFEGSLRAYLFGAVTKASFKFLERNGQIVFRDIEERADHFFEEMTYDEEELKAIKDRLYREIELLPENARKVFNAIVLEGLTYKEVAERLNVSVNTVKTHYSHALKKLRERLGDLFVVALLCL